MEMTTVVFSDDAEKMCDFFEAILGCRIVFREKVKGFYAAYVPEDGTNLWIVPAEKEDEQRSENLTLIFEFSDLDVVCRRVSKVTGDKIDVSSGYVLLDVMGVGIILLQK